MIEKWKVGQQKLHLCFAEKVHFAQKVLNIKSGQSL